MSDRVLLGQFRVLLVFCIVVAGTIHAVEAQAPLQTVRSLSANNGLYSNQIVVMTHVQPYTEVCIKNSGIEFDIHEAGESTVGGNCLAGDTGWLIERNQRSMTGWSEAKLECLKDGMRLLESFEWQISCLNSADLALVDMVEDSSEWGSNTARPLLDAGLPRMVAGLFGKESCFAAGWGSVGADNGVHGVTEYRCAM